MLACAGSVGSAQTPTEAAKQRLAARQAEAERKRNEVKHGAAAATADAAKKAAAPADAKAAAPAAPAAASQTPPALQADQAVEVRDGDEWSKATFLKREGRKLQVRYEDGTEEWVTADRLRVPGEGAGQPAAKTADGKPAAKAPKDQFATGARVEVKEHSSWSAATIKNRDGDLYLVATDRFPTQFHWMWVHVSGVRRIGSSKEGPNSPKTIGVNNQGVAKAKEEAKRTFANIEDELAADETRGGRGILSVFEQAKYDKPVSDVILDKVRELDVVGAPEKLAAFDALPAGQVKFDGKPIAIKSQGVWPNEAPDTVLIGGGLAVIPFYSGSAGEQRTLRVEVLDLVTGQNLGTAKADPLSKPKDVSPSGLRMVGVAHGFHTGTRRRVDVFELPKPLGEPKHLISFEPYVTAEYQWKDVQWASFADDERVMTCTWQGDLMCWDAPKATALWKMKIRGGTYPALSPGRRQVAVATDAGIAVVDAVAGKVLCLAGGRSASGSLAFTPDGRRLVGIWGSTVFGWDLEKGAALPEIGLPTQSVRGGVVALDNRFVLVGGTDLLDLDRKLVVWRYRSGGDAFVAHGGRCWMLSGGRHGARATLSSAALPHAGAVKAADALAPGQGLLVKPGVAVALTVALEATPEQQQQVTDAITKQLQAQGMRVDPASPIKLIARTEQGKTTQQTYEVRQFGQPPTGATETVSVTEKITRLFFELDGKVVWESRTSSGGAPMFVQANEGQTVNDVVQAGSKFNVKFLESVRVPAFIQRPAGKPWLGESKWDATGVGGDKLFPLPPPANPAAAAPGHAGGDGRD